MFLAYAVLAVILLGGCQKEETDPQSGGNSRAEQLFSVGDYYGARTEYRYENDPEMAAECSYRIAQEYYESGKYQAAYLLYGTIRDYRDSAEREAESLDGFYREGVQKLFRGEFEAAEKIFREIGTYRFSSDYAELCKERLELAKDPERDHQLNHFIRDSERKDGTLYVNDEVYLYVPNRCDENTRMFVFFPGGLIEDRYLPYAGMISYLDSSMPNAVIIFSQSSWYGYFTQGNRYIGELMKDTADCLGIAAHDVAVVGASAGSFSALHAGAELYELFRIRVDTVVSLDAALEWNDPAQLSEEELETLRKNGTRLLLFEQPGVGLEIPSIAEMVEKGCDVTVVGCRHKVHNEIAFRAFDSGVFDYAMRFIDESGLEEGEYSFEKLY